MYHYDKIVEFGYRYFTNDEVENQLASDAGSRKRMRDERYT